MIYLMSLEIVSNELAILLIINLNYLSTKKDKYENEISYFVIENENLMKLLRTFLKI